MKTHQSISIIYGILLIIGIVFCIGGLIFIPIHTYDANENVAIMKLVPTDIKTEGKDIQEFYFSNVDWEKNGNCLHFISSHQEITVVADGEVIFERKTVRTIWGNTPGYSWEYIEIPAEAKDVTVTVTACYPAVRNVEMTFYQGFSLKMLWNLFRQESFTAIISFLNLCLGVILLIYGSIMRKQSNIGSAMLYLGIFNILLGIWSLSENGIVAILVKNRAANSTISFLSLALIGMPFIMFVRCYLQTVDKYLYRILVGLNSLNVILMILLQIFGIRDMKETLSLAHITIIASFLYLPVSLVHMIHIHMITHRFWVTVFSLACMFPPLAYSLYLYYYTSNNISSYGNIFLFLFVSIFAVDVTKSIKKDVDAGKKSAIYKELAEKDMLTGCYNRNAYRNDTGNWADLQGVLLITCDLNNLKQCNDTLGHAYGDQYITDSAAMLKKVFSQYGKVYRIGGDEFCIIIPDGRKCDIDKLLDVLTEEQRIYNEKSEVIRLQIACGYAVFDGKTDSDMEDIRNRADERMYTNKKEIKLRLAQMSMR